jgi:NAD(P)-dependent dehydrogenase (short-subunit alcohol dehydrogenase family)
MVSVNVWVGICLALTLVLLLGGGYSRVEKLAVLKVSFFTVLTMAAAAVLLFRPGAFTTRDLAEGLSFKVPIGGLAISNGLRPGLAMVAKTLADELGPRGVRVFGLMPGLVSTDRTAQLYADEQGRQRAQGGIPLRRFGEPAEFGRVAAFALSPAASYLSGCVIPVDGGALRTL